jgi:thiol:disulfide interchange protein
MYTSKFRFVAVLFAFGALQAVCVFGQAATKPEAQSAAGPDYVVAHQFDPARNATADIEQAIAEAQKTGKRVLVDVGGDWCHWCRTLDQFFQEHQDLLQSREAGFITVKVYYGKDNKNEQALSQYSKVLGIPHFFVLDENGTLLHSQHVIELQKDGAYNPDKMREFLTKWSRASGSTPNAESKKRQDTATVNIP